MPPTPLLPALTPAAASAYRAELHRRPAHLPSHSRVLQQPPLNPDLQFPDPRFSELHQVAQLHCVELDGVEGRRIPALPNLACRLHLLEHTRSTMEQGCLTGLGNTVPPGIKQDCTILG